jgi:peroxiredoxin
LDQAHDEIRAAGGEIVCVFMYRAAPTRNFCRKRGVDLDCLGDPEREGYRAVGLGRGGISEMASPKVAIGAIRAARQGAVMGGREGGDVRQMPGTFVVGSDGKVLFAHYNRDQSDNPNVQDVIAAVQD